MKDVLKTALSSGKLNTILSGAGSVLSDIGSKLPKAEDPQTKSLFGRKEDEEIAQLQADLGEKEKKQKQTMYIAIAVVLALLLFGKKLMK